MTYDSGGFDLHVTDAELGGILEKIRIEAPDFEDNKAWNFDTSSGWSTHDDMFGYHPVEVDATYFDSKATYRTKPYTITEKQFRSAFTSIDSVLEFIGRIESRVKAKYNLAITLLNHRAVVALIAERLKMASLSMDGNGVIDLTTEYITETGDTAFDSATWKTNPKFLLWVNTFIRQIYDIMREPNGMFNPTGYISQTTADNSKFYLLSDLSRAIESYVYRSSYNVEDVRLTGYKTIAYWQKMGKSTLARGFVNAIPPSEGEPPTEGEDTRTAYKAQVLGVIFNRYAAFINAKRIETGVQNNPFDKWDNYVHMFEAGYYVDPDENAVIFTITHHEPETTKTETTKKTK